MKTKMIHMIKEMNTYVGIICVIILSIIMFLILGNVNLNFGLYDDNQTQWLPIIDKAYQILFQTGNFPTIDFLQMKGMKIYDQGYYGLWNPFMLIAYVLKTYILFFLNTNTLTIYIIIMIILGNICCYKIFQEAKVNPYYSVIMSSVLMTTSIYTALSYWYYIYNVYFILTWLLFRIMKKKKSKSYYEYGAILALSLLMGNVQYTVYMYLAFVLMMLVIFFRGDRNVIGKIFSNTLCMGILSFFHLILLLGASTRSVDFSGNSNGFYSDAIHPILVFLFSWIPSSFLGTSAETLENIILASIPMPEANSFPGIRCYYLGVGVCAVTIFLFQRKKYTKDWLYEITSASLFAVCVFIVISLGKIGILAIFVEQVPFLNSFRILAKYFVLIPPLLLPCIAVVLREHKNKFFVVFLMFMLFGLIQNRQLAFGVSQIQTEDSVEHFQELDIDYHNYRIVSFASYDEIQVTYPEWEDFAKRERISLEEKFSKNAGVLADVITLGGYDLAFDYKQFQMSESIMGTVSGYASEFGYDNMIIEEYFFGRYDRNYSDYQTSIEKLKQQIQDNGIKYFIFSKDSSCVTTFLQMLEDMQLEVEWQQSFMENTEMIAIKNTNPIIINAKGEKIEAKITMDKITFASQQGQNFRIAMYYDENLKALHVDNNGDETELSILPDEKGYIVVSGINDTDNGMIEISYSNPLYEIGKIWTIIVLLFIFFMAFAPEFVWIRNFVNLLEKKIKYCFSHVLSLSPQRGIWICFAVLLCSYICFLGFYYLHVQCTVPDEEWFLQIFKTIHNLAEENFFSYFGETENYLGYGQIYWILGSMFSNMYILRIAAFLMLIGSMFLVLREVKIRFGMQMIPYAGILWISMPFTWYSDKIIGPEIFGYFLGLLGLTILCIKKNRWIGWCLLGICCAVKVNYAVFVLIALLLEIKREGRKDIALVKAGLSGIMGFVLGNPIILWDFRTFLENVHIEGAISFNQLSYVFERREHEWDGVMVNGVFWGYISPFLLFVLITGLMIKKWYKNDKYLKNKENRHYGNYMVEISLLLILICCRNIFLGWYLLPLSYFLVVAACSLFDFKEIRRKNRNLCQWLFLICLLVNVTFLLPEHISNRLSNVKYIEMMENQNEIIEMVNDAKENIEEQNQEAKWHYLLDFQMEEYSYNFGDYGEFCINNAEGIAIIGERMRIVDSIDEIIQKAIRKEEGLCVLQQFEDVWIVKRECE